MLLSSLHQLIDIGNGQRAFKAVHSIGAELAALLDGAHLPIGQFGAMNPGAYSRKDQPNAPSYKSRVASRSSALTAKCDS